VPGTSLALPWHFAGTSPRRSALAAGQVHLQVTVPPVEVVW
jgi:hypothetical protein